MLPWFDQEGNRHVRFELHSTWYVSGDSGGLISLFLFFPGKEKESKETARAPLGPARRRCGRSARKLTRLRLGYGGLRQSARFFPSAPSMLGAGQWENQNQRLKSPILSPFEWG